MTTHAYFEDYVPLAQKNLGHMLDFAVNTCNLNITEFYNFFLSSNISVEFANGNPKYVAGMSGCELVTLICLEAAISLEQDPVMYLDKSPEFWAGWAIAYYQWYRSKSFLEIAKVISMEEVICMYSTLHEADIMKFVSIVDERFIKAI